jgi:histidinol-phosphate aminotransferase
MKPLELVRKNILALTPYSTARDEYHGTLGVFLDANENPYPNGYNRYPDPTQAELKEVLAGIKGVPAEQIFVGNGSDEAIDLCYRIFCEPRTDNAIAIAPSYGMYRVAAAINDVEMREVRLRADFSLDAEAILGATDAHTKLLFLCSPNNPSGNLLERGEIERLLEQFPGMLVLDEAYVDFADDEGFLPTIDRYPNLIILQTLSKAWGMAGLRLGLAFGAREVMDIFARVKYPYNINVATQHLVLEQLRQKDKVQRQIAEINGQRARVAEALKANPAVMRVFPSDANFVLIKTSDPRRMYETLIAQGVIVRDRSRIAGCEGCLRITVGTPAENDILIEILRTYR